MSQTVNQTNIFTPTLCCSYLDNLANKMARYEASLLNPNIEKVALTCIERVVDFVFYYIFYIFYPSYEQFYYDRLIVAFDSAGLNLPKYEGSCFKESVLFFHRFIASPSTIGSIFPSSSGLINSITKKIAENLSPNQTYLEIGAGTGCFTEEIIKKMKPGDHLDVVEYDAELCKLLKRKFHHLKNVTIHQISILDFKAEKYDAVISGLPLNVFEPDFVDRVLEKYIDLIKDGGYLSYMELMGLGSIKEFFLCGEAGENFRKILASKAAFVEKYGSEVVEIYCNITPARVHHCKMKTI